MRVDETLAGPRILVVLGDGGHTAEILRLVELMGPAYDFHYVAAHEDGHSAERIGIPGPMYRIRRPRGKSESWFSAMRHLVVSLTQALRACHRVRPLAVLGSGPSVMVPVALVARVLGSKVIFVETGSRVTALSLTGKIMLRLANLYFVQWEQLQRRYPNTVYGGRLL
ncbi:MAG: PssD/Cps14F family polysaccharide biosynthesis glycosyltransferase [Acidobacteriota bacterium]